MKKRFPLMFKTTTVMLHINQNKFVLFKNFAKLPICVKLLFNKSRPFFHMEFDCLPQKIIVCQYALLLQTFHIKQVFRKSC